MSDINAATNKLAAERHVGHSKHAPVAAVLVVLKDAAMGGRN